MHTQKHTGTHKHTHTHKPTNKLTAKMHTHNTCAPQNTHNKEAEHTNYGHALQAIGLAHAKEEKRGSVCGILRELREVVRGWDIGCGRWETGGPLTH